MEGLFLKRNLSMKLILLPIEVYRREFHSRLVLAGKLLESEEIKVYLLDQDFLFFLSRLNLIIPCVTLVKSLQGYAKRWFNHFFKSGSVVCLQDEEGLVSFNGMHNPTTGEKVFYSRNSAELVRYCRAIFCWSSDELKYYSSKYGDVECLQIGNDRTARLTAKNIRTDYTDEIVTLNKDYDRVILFSSTFVQGLKDIGQDAKELQLKEFEAENYPEPIKWAYGKWRQHSQITLFAFMEFVRLFKRSELARTHTLIFRPHPTESITLYSHLFQNIEEVRVDDRFGIEPWLDKAEVLVGSNCTTLVEAAVYGKPTISFLPKIDDCFDKVLKQTVSDKFSFTAESPQELLDQLQSLIKERQKLKSQIEDNKRALKDFVAFDCDWADVQSRRMLEYSPLVSKWQVRVFAFNLRVAAIFYMAYSWLAVFLGKGRDDRKLNDKANLKSVAVSKFRNTDFEIEAHWFYIAISNR